MRNLLQILRQADRRRDCPWALATLVCSEGSTYRKPGARLLCDAEGRTTGVLSGGCLEEEVAAVGQNVIASGEPQILRIDTRLRYGCDGRLEILVERIPPATTGENLLTRLSSTLAARKTCRVRSRFRNATFGSELLDHGAWIADEEEAFDQIIHPPTRLLILGQGPEVDPLMGFASLLGWTTQSIRHIDEMPDDFSPDPQTAALIMTHHFSRDLACLERLLPLRLAYIALMGPRKRRGELLARLYEDRPFEKALLEPLHSPAGLDIGSEAPEEIALSIIAEVAAVLSGRGAGFLRDRRAPIHQSILRQVA